MIKSEEIIIKVTNLKAAYGTHLVLQQINFQVYRGEIFVIMGRSGSGKSTLLRHLIGLYRPVEGEVWIEGQNIAAATKQERQRILRKFGVLYQSGALFGSMSAFENVRMPLDELTNLPELAKDLAALSKLKLVGLAASAQAMPSELSGGMQKRAAIARAMALDPRILFLDEPSVGLDPVTSAGLDDLIRELRRGFGITFVIVTHELESIFTVADRAIMLDDESKTIIAEGTPIDLRDKSTDLRVQGFFRRRSEGLPTQTAP